MDNREIVARLQAFLEETFPNQAVELTPTTDLLDEWFVDSLGIIETVLFLENAFGIAVRRADINGTNFKCIASLAEFVASRIHR